MYLILADGYKNAGVHYLRLRKTGEIWSSIKDVHKSLGVKNMFDVILKEMYDIYETKNLTNKQIQTEREIFEKYDNLSKDELNTKTNKNIYVKNDVMSTVIKRCRGEEKKEVKEKYMDLEKN